MNRNCINVKAIGETSLRNRIRVSLFLDSLLFVSIASFFLTDYEHEEYVKIFVFFLIIMVWCSSHRSPPKVYCKIDFFIGEQRRLLVGRLWRVSDHFYFLSDSFGGQASVVIRS